MISKYSHPRKQTVNFRILLQKNATRLGDMPLQLFSVSPWSGGTSTQRKSFWDCGHYHVLGLASSSSELEAKDRGVHVVSTRTIIGLPLPNERSIGSAAGACWCAGGRRGDHRNGGAERGGPFSFDPKDLTIFLLFVVLEGIRSLCSTLHYYLGSLTWSTGSLNV